jgi:drug/metabolite transporter (DMT)-like permease
VNIRESRRGFRSGGSVIPALLVIAVGAIFLLDNLGIHMAFFHRQNWWAWLILFGAIAPLSAAVQRYRTLGTVDGAVLHSLLNAAAVVTVALIFLLQLSWGQWWPVFVIYGGLCMLARNWKVPADDQAA